ncbi:DMT family transporter [Legionella sp. W05-934-2]|jgi:drug/metabolite transporter (DMT)-like permease|uniref:DMT family transporter n=1 Tax=Legionella sp. W05-934-2 TaxID=1198649 RepID=UPI0034636219
MSTFLLPFAIFTTLFFWASAFVGIRLGLSDFSPGALALYRFFVGSLILSVVIGSLQKLPSVSTKHRIQLMLVGVFAIGVYNFCLNYGEINIDAGVASFIIGQVPVITIILSVVLLREKLPWRSWIGILLSIIGLMVIAMGNRKGAFIDANVLIIMIASACGAFYTLTQRRYLKFYHPVSVTTWVMWGGTLSLLVFFPQLVAEIKQSSLQGNLTVIYLGIGPAALAYLGWCYILNRMPVSKAALYLYGLPLISTILGFIILHESPSPMGLIGGLMAILGAVLASYYLRQQPLRSATQQSE